VHEELSKYPNFYDIFAKIYKIPEFYMFPPPKMPEFYIIIARKIFSRILGGAPVSYAYDSWCCFAGCWIFSGHLAAALSDCDVNKASRYKVKVKGEA